MLLSLVDSLRCPAGHEETSLVLSVEAWSGQRVSEGQLGCPVCHARYPIHQGAVDFVGGSPLVRPRGPDEPVDVARLAAQLSLTEPGGILLLTGRYAATADQLADFADVIGLVIDAPLSMSPASVNLEVSDRLPLVAGALRGAAVDGVRKRPGLMTEIARCVRSKGRIVSTSEADVPLSARILARDEREWVAEVQEIIPTTPLKRSRSL